MSTTIDCDSLPGKLAEICRGEARKANGRLFSLRERQEIIGRREGVSPSQIVLPDATEEIPERSQRHTTYSGIGDRLHQIIKRETGASIPCSACKREIDALNGQNAQQVLSSRDALAKRIVQRAKASAPRWWQRWGARLANRRARQRVAGWIDEACGTSDEPAEDDAEPHSPVGRIVTAVRTAKRDEPTLSDTLTSLHAAGFETPILFGEPDAPGDVDVRWQENKRSFRGFVDHARWLLENTDGTWFLLCEDDVEFSTGLADRLSRLSLAGQIVTLFKPHGVSLSGEGLVTARAVNGSLAVLIRRQELRSLIESRTSKSWKRSDCVDKFLTRAAREIGATLLSPVRSWVQHTGRTSVCQPRRWKQNSLTHRMRYASDFESPPEIRVVSDAPELTLITPTGERPDAFALCERWMARQTYRQPYQWIVVDDGSVPTPVTCGQQYIRRSPQRGHTLTANLRAALPQANGRKVLIIEDDEYYAPDYLERMSSWLNDDALVGAGYARYYWPRLARYREFPGHAHASLCRTGFRREMIGTVTECCQTSDPTIDLRLWSRVEGRRHFPDRPLVIGMKQMPGRKSGGGDPSSGRDDSGLATLRHWVGDDVESYRRFLPKSLDAVRAQREKIVVYTVVIGGYDRILTPLIVNPDVRYVAVTDGPAPSPWEIMRPPHLTGNRKRDSRRWKLLAHELFPTADWTIYVDGQLQLAVDPLMLLAECDAWGEGDLFLFRHHERDCLYDEARAVLNVRKDTRQRVEPHVRRYRSSGFPEHAGLYMGGMLVRSPAAADFNDVWWAEVERGSCRDQISLPVALANSGVNYTALPALWWIHYFLRHYHTRAGAVGRRRRSRLERINPLFAEPL